MGLGREVALLFASKHKCNVIIYDIRTELGKDLVKEINELGGKGYFYECDISKREIIKKVFTETLNKFQTIDILVNNAAVVTPKKVESFKEEEVEYDMSVNFFGPYYLMKQTLAVMRKQNSGHLVSIASVAAHVYTPETAVYSASKAAMFNLFSSLRLELKEEKSPIKTTIVCPWVVDTGMFEGFKVRFTFFGLLNFLKTKQVSQKIYDAIIYEKDELYLPFYHQIAFRIILMLPSWISDFLVLWLSKDSMKNFVGRSKKIN